MDQNSVIERLKKFVLAHPEMAKSGFIKGLDTPTGKIVIVVNGQDKLITIDELENGHLNKPSQTIKEEPIEVMEDEEIETLDAPVSNEKQIVTLEDMNNAILSKNEAAVDKALATFAINEKTGSIDVNKAIKIITDNSTNNVVECVKNNKGMPNGLANYDIKGNIISGIQDGAENIESLIDKSFNNILVYVGASKLKNIVYNERQIELAKNKYATSINDRLNVLGLNKKEDNVVEFKKEEKPLSLELRPDKNLKKAGFADIFILTLIVLIYVAIIVNLISKIN